MTICFIFEIKKINTAFTLSLSEHYFVLYPVKILLGVSVTSFTFVIDDNAYDDYYKYYLMLIMYIQKIIQTLNAVPPSMFFFWY